MSLLIWLAVPSMVAIVGMAFVITNQTLYPRLREQQPQVQESGALGSERPAGQERGSVRAA